MNWDRLVLRDEKGKRRPCVVCGKFCGVIDPHHILAQQQLKRVAQERGLDIMGLLWDARNGLAVGRPCHEAHETASKRIPREKVPEAALEFARELDLVWAIERYYPKAG